MIDAHIHLQDKRFDADRGDLIKRAQDKGVTAFFAPRHGRGTLNKSSDWRNGMPALFLLSGHTPGSRTNMIPKRLTAFCSVTLSPASEK